MEPKYTTLNRDDKIREIHKGYSDKIINEREKIVLLRKANGRTIQEIADEMGCTKQNISVLKCRAERYLKKGERKKRGRPKGSFKKMPEEYVIKLSRRERDSLLSSRDIKAAIMNAEARSHPYWTHAMVNVLDQIAEQNINTVTVKEEELF